jgi:hypothetical protein
MNNQEKAKKLRGQGLTYGEIGVQIGVSGTMARRYVLDINPGRPTEKENAPFVCKKRHKGIHCSQRETDLLGIGEWPRFRSWNNNFQILPLTR